MKLYPKIRSNRNMLNIHKFKVGEEVWIEEKIDGSNFGFFQEGKKIRYFSRNQEIFAGDGSSFSKLIEECNEKWKGFSLDEGVLFFCEYIKMGKIKYGEFTTEFDRLVGIDMLEVDNIDEWMGSEESDRQYKRLNESHNIYTFTNSLKIPYTPIIKESFKWEENSYETIKLAYGSERSFINPESKAEGIVIKSQYKTMKIVSEEFREIMKEKKHNKDKIDYTRFMANPRINKYIARLVEEGLIPQQWNDKDYTIIFKNTHLFIDDILEEENKAIMKMIKKEMRKQASKTIQTALLTEAIKPSEFQRNDYSYEKDKEIRELKEGESIVYTASGKELEDILKEQKEKVIATSDDGEEFVLTEDGIFPKK